MIGRLATGAAATLLFAVVATANSGGYRYGVSDQAFYLPAIAKSLDPTLFPRDTPLLEAQMRLWLGDDVVRVLARGAAVDLPTLAAWSYGVGLILLAAAVAYFLRGLGASWLAVGAGLTMAALRHQITKTGASSLEGYFHPRMLGYALGLFALGCVLRRRYGLAFVLIVITALLHTTTALWFGGAVVAAAAWHADRRATWAVAGGIGLVAVALAVWGQRMDAPWLATIAGKSYLFPSAWPLYAWVLNLSYPVVLWLIYRRRLAAGQVASGEGALVVGLLVLVAGFLVTVPLSAADVALAVQLQVTRVFWVLDAATLLYVMWWLIDDVGARRSARWRISAVGILAAIAIFRGGYVLTMDVQRPLASWAPPAGDWTGVMNWVGEQPANLSVLADPGHAWRYGSSIRMASFHDTTLEETKDTALAIYDRGAARRVQERALALSGFESFSTDQIRAVGTRFDADVVLVERTRRLDLPVLFENGSFTVYDLR